MAIHRTLCQLLASMKVFSLIITRFGGCPKLELFLWFENSSTLEMKRSSLDLPDWQNSRQNTWLLPSWILVTKNSRKAVKMGLQWRSVLSAGKTPSNIQEYHLLPSWSDPRNVYMTVIKPRATNLNHPAFFLYGVLMPENSYKRELSFEEKDFGLFLAVFCCASGNCVCAETVQHFVDFFRNGFLFPTCPGCPCQAMSLATFELWKNHCFFPSHFISSPF